MQKMFYSKLFILLLIISSFSSVCYAESWKVVFDGLNKTYIDVDSINYHNESLYYNVTYFDPKTNEYIVSTVQSKNDTAGIVATCKYSEYTSNKDFAKALTPKTATNFKHIYTNSLLYNANSEAWNIYNNPKYKNTTNENEVDFTLYMKVLQEKIKQLWEPPQYNKKNRVVVQFKISRDGRLLSPSIIESSGYSNVDNAALKAVISASPFAPLPAGYKEESIEIKFSFDYNT